MISPKRKLMNRITVCLAAFACLFGLGVSWARADDNDGPRQQLDKVLGVLRLKTDAAGHACLEAMKQVHETEEQVKEHQSDATNKPDLSIAQDVLESDYQNSTQLCGADAARVCREDHDANLQKPCQNLQFQASP